jgi:hypothetical protein
VVDREVKMSGCVEVPVVEERRERAIVAVIYEYSPMTKQIPSAGQPP